MNLVKLSAVPAVMIAVMLVPLDVSAEVSDELERGRGLVRSFDYDGALEAFQSVRDSEAASPEQRLEAIARIGSVHFRQRDEAQAREAFQRLLDLDPGHELDDRAFSPRVRGFFADVVGSYQPNVGLRLDVSVIQDETTGDRARVTVLLDGPEEAVAEIIVRARSGGGAYDPLVVGEAGDGFVARLDIHEEGRGIEYYVEARAPSGYVLARHGSTDQPERFEPQLALLSRRRADGTAAVESPRRPWYRTWWFWTAVGAVVLGGATAAVVLTLPEEQQSGSLGTGRLE